MSMLGVVEKDPDAVLPYQFDWAEWLNGDTIAAHEAMVSPIEQDGVVVDSSSHTDTTVTVWLSGGVRGKSYTVTCRVHPAAGAGHDMKDDRSFLVRVMDR